MGLTFSGVNAQEEIGNNGFLSFNYAISGGLGSLNEYIGKPSFRGFNFDYRRRMNEHVSAGVMLGWTHFYEKLDRAEYQAPDNPNVTVNAVQSRKVSAMPITLQGHYYFVNSSGIEPYLGFGMGAYRMEYEKWWGAIQERNDTWKFGINGQFGATIPIAKDYVGLNVGMVYHWIPYEYNELDGTSFLNLNLGLYLNF